jgi:hypothetical protein
MISSQTDAGSKSPAEQIDQANTTGKTPVVFIHGLWLLLPSSWDRWSRLRNDPAQVKAAVKSLEPVATR